MKRHKLILGALLIATLPILFSLTRKENVEKEKTVKAETEKPNIVVILCDDLGYGDLSSFGHPTIQTPVLDKMAKDGIKLTNFYSAAPVCSPSRVGLLTGRSPNKAGIYDFILSGNKKRMNNRDMVHLQANEVTLPALLKTTGYATALVGKWHCSSKFNSEEQPQPNDFGFDHWFATHNNASPSHENPRNFVRNGKKVGEIEGYSCQIVVDEATDWLSKKAEKDPFYLQVTFHEPHEPIASPQDLVNKYLKYTDDVDQATYFANVENVDIAVGRLLEYLKKNVKGNTLIVFSSDNGPETLNRYPKAKRSYGSPGELKGMKLWTTEAGFRVPGIMYWMGKETFTGTSDAIISSLDYLPTFCELAGVDLPKRPIDGESFASFFDKGKFEREKPLIWTFYSALNTHVVAMRSGDWKIMARLKSNTGHLQKLRNVYQGNEDLVKNAELADFELYNMVEDVKESKNVGKKNPKVFDEMKAKLKLEYDKLLEESYVWNR